MKFHKKNANENNDHYTQPDCLEREYPCQCTFDRVINCIQQVTSYLDIEMYSR